jgi:Leucine-rich repeat (LRR) protein
MHFDLPNDEHQTDSPGGGASGRPGYRKAESSMSTQSSASQQQRELKKREITNQWSADRRAKFDSEHHDVGHILEGTAIVVDAIPTPGNPPLSGAELSPSSSSTAPVVSFLPPMQHQQQLPPPAMPSRPGMSSLDRSSSDQSTSSLFYGKTPNSGALLGKSSSLIFPTMEAASKPVEGDMSLRRRINLLLDQCESVRFPFKKKLILADLSLTAADIPLGDLCGTSLGNSLHKLSLAGNRLGTVPPALVQNLPGLRHLDLSQCELHHLPEKWNLPKLTRLNLSHNRLTDFPEEVSNTTLIGCIRFGSAPRLY